MINTILPISTKRSITLLSINYDLFAVDKTAHNFDHNIDLKNMHTKFLDISWFYIPLKNNSH
jgi:hypothetical protein